MSGHPTKYDYDALERQYVYGTMSIRALCEANGIKTWSTVTQQAKSREWDRKRAEYQELASRKEMTVVADQRASKLEKLTDDIIDTVHAAVFRYVENLTDRVVVGEDGKSFVIPGIVVDTADLVKLIDKVQLLKGQPTSREAHLGINLSRDLSADDVSGLPRDVLRELAHAARAAGAGTATGGSSPIPRIEGAKQLN